MNASVDIVEVLPASMVASGTTSSGTTANGSGSYKFLTHGGLSASLGHGI
ncbi:MAG: hypothetical protein NTZ90_09510 [Proteobacteria bacterium]|nr:hypothetical protein [Pseudomonadota bacterium]